MIDRKLLVAVDGYPTESKYDWVMEGTNEVSITIARNHPKYCEECRNMQQSIYNSFIIHL